MVTRRFTKKGFTNRRLFNHTPLTTHDRGSCGDTGALRRLRDIQRNVRGSAIRLSGVSAMKLTSLYADMVESSPPEMPCHTALPAEDVARSNASSSLGMREAPSPGDVRDSRSEERGVHSVSSSFERANWEAAKQLQGMSWSLEDFNFLGCLGTGRVSKVGAVPSYLQCCFFSDNSRLFFTIADSGQTRGQSSVIHISILS